MPLSPVLLLAWVVVISGTLVSLDFGNDFGMDSHFAFEAVLISIFCFSGCPDVYICRFAGRPDGHIFVLRPS